jgi:membrane protein implicated in regulation of membrane protease activity
MNSGVLILLGVVWLTLSGLAALVVYQRAPKRRKPADELEAADAALRGRINDLEDRFEHFVKRQAGRTSRENADGASRGADGAPDRAQSVLELTRLARARGLR